MISLSMDSVDIITMYVGFVLVIFMISTAILYVCKWTCYSEMYTFIGWIASMGFVGLIATKKI